MYKGLKNIELNELLLCAFLVVFKYIPSYLFNVLFSKTRSNIWIISERKNDARDNGYWLFRYLREKHPELEVYYAIDVNCADYRKVRIYGNVVDWGSYRHYYILSRSAIIASTDFGLGFPRLLMRPIVMRIMPLKQKFVFLQHGVIKDNLTHAKKHKLRADLFVCGAKPEYDYILKNFGYSDKEVKYLGLARFDSLCNTSCGKQILYMPTWRNGLKDEGFQNSAFNKAISSFLSSDGLKTFLTETNTKLIFFLHPAFREKKRHFKTFTCDNIEIANNEDYDLQDLLKSSSLLITDYSSIYFDFAYMNKPVIYYQFDYEEYRENQYGEGYFSYEHNGFGPVVKNEEKLIESIRSNEKTGWKNIPYYSNRSNDFFPLKDINNCERHFKELSNLIKSKKSR